VGTALRDAITAKIRSGDDKALAVVAGQLAMDESARRADAAEVESETADLVALAEALRDGYTHFGPSARADEVEALRLILDRLAREGVGRDWTGVLKPAHELMTSALADSHVQARVAALEVLRQLWSWAPGRTMTPGEETAVGTWKEGCYALAAKRLSDPEGVARAAAAGCVGSLPIDDLARPAVACLRDPELSVRYQSLVALANRPNVLGEEELLPLLHDPVADLAKLAEKVLAGRGLDAELIAVSRMATAPKPEMRASVIPILVKRQDIDPVVWLLRLTEDADAAVRLKAVEALAGRVTPEVRQRLRELAAADDSAAVRAAAEKLAPAQTTAALPPLPGSASLNPRAN
jgi:HEAT repeat protein